MASTVQPPRERHRRPFVPRASTIVEPYRLTPRLATRLAILGVLALALFAALLLRLWALQVLQGTQYRQTALDNQLRTVRLQSQRGLIVDRDGTPLVTNAAATAIEIWPADLPKVYADRYRELRRISQITQVPLYQIAAAIKRNGGDPVTPVTIKSSAHRDLISFLAERRDQFPGIEATDTWIRHYPYQSLGAQVLGYVGEISPQQLKLKENEKLGYLAGDEIGQAGVEARYDGYLRGKPGLAQMRVDSLGRPRSDLTQTRASQVGRTLKLTIDLGLQQAAEKGLDYGIHLAQTQGHWASQGGAIVAMDPRDGSILAMASAPTYKPSVYAGRVTRTELADQGLLPSTAEKKDYPALNRATEGAYPPGSTFKPVTAIAAMAEHLITPGATLPCTGTWTAPEDRSHHVFHNWDPFVDQQMNMATALAASCDTYFYQLGNDFYELPADRGQPLQRWAAKFGFGQRTGIDVGPESAGLLPTIPWRERTYTQKTDPCCWQVDRLWKPGDSIQLAIGQKDLLVTPLQMARFYSLIANGGKLVYPHVRDEVLNPNGTPVPMPALPAPRQLDVDPIALQSVREGLLEGTHLSFGTSYGVFGHFPVSIAGKTGTAEKVVTLPGYTGLQDQSWSCDYGPYDSPTLVVCAVIENGGHGGTAAAPAVLQVFQRYFHVKSVTTGTIHSD